MIVSETINPIVGSNSRSELKYLISEEVAERVRNAVVPWMDVDPHTNSLTERYPVHTIYLEIYRKSVNKEADRFKLRMRFYDDEPSSPVFLEVKRADGGRSVKSRVAVARDAAASVFSADFGENPATDNGDREFWDAVFRFKARPIIHIAYDREAFVGAGEAGTRLTMDRQVRFEPAPKGLSTKMQTPIPIWNGKVILEVKFAHTMPEYLDELIQSLGLQSANASKYIKGVHARMKTRRISSGGRSFENDALRTGRRRPRFYTGSIARPAELSV